MIQYTDNMKNNTNKKDTMTKLSKNAMSDIEKYNELREQELTEKNTMTIKNKRTQETLQNFISRGGKLEILPAQKSNYKHVSNCQSKYVLSSKFSASSVHKNNRSLAA